MGWGQFTFLSNHPQSKLKPTQLEPSSTKSVASFNGSATTNIKLRFNSQWGGWITAWGQQVQDQRLLPLLMDILMDLLMDLQQLTSKSDSFMGQLLTSDVCDAGNSKFVEYFYREALPFQKWCFFGKVSNDFDPSPPLESLLWNQVCRFCRLQMAKYRPQYVRKSAT